MADSPYDVIIIGSGPGGYNGPEPYRDAGPLCGPAVAFKIRLAIPEVGSPMFLKQPEPKYIPGTRVRVVQHLRVGHRRWVTEVVGTVEGEGLRPVGGMEMGGKALYCHQPTLHLRRDDGELMEIALDGNTRVETPEPAGSAAGLVTGGPPPRPV